MVKFNAKARKRARKVSRKLESYNSDRENPRFAQGVQRISEFKLLLRKAIKRIFLTHWRGWK